MIVFQHSKAHASRFYSGAAKAPSTIIRAQFIAGSPLSINVQDFRHGKTLKGHLRHMQSGALSRASCNALSASLSSSACHLVRANMGYGGIIMGGVSASRLMLPNQSFEADGCAAAQFQRSSAIALIARFAGSIRLT